MVFADLVGSTELAADLDPEELRGKLTPFFDVARATLEEHGGTIEKDIGDAVLAVFGVPRAHGDDPDRAVAAALALIEREQAGEPRVRGAGGGGGGGGALAGRGVGPEGAGEPPAGEGGAHRH